MLSQTEVVPYLVDAGIVARREVVGGRLRVTDLSRRNAVFLVERGRPPSVVVKQPLAGDDPGVARDAAVLRALRRRAGLREALPVVVRFDPDARVLVLEAVPGATGTAGRAGRDRLPALAARAGGRALASLHALPADLAGPRPPGVEPAWTLRWHRPGLTELAELSAAGVELLREGQRSASLNRAVDELRASPGAPALVHGDARWDNWLASAPRAGSRRTRMTLVDWELAGPGDPAMDLGAFLGDALSERLASGPRRGSAAATARAFWEGYAGAWRKDGGTGPDLHRAVRWAGIRLVQRAVERAQEAPALDARTVRALQLGVGVLSRPEAAARLLGLPEPELVA